METEPLGAPFYTVTFCERSSCQSGLGLSHNSRKTCFIINSHVSQNFAIQFDRSFFGTGDECAVADAEFTACCIDTRDPQCAEHTFFVASVAISILTSFHDSL